MSLLLTNNVFSPRRVACATPIYPNWSWNSDSCTIVVFSHWHLTTLFPFSCIQLDFLCPTLHPLCSYKHTLSRAFTFFFCSLVFICWNSYVIFSHGFLFYSCRDKNSNLPARLTIAKIEFYSSTRSIDTYSMHKNLLQFHWQKISHLTIGSKHGSVELKI